MIALNWSEDHSYWQIADSIKGGYMDLTLMDKFVYIRIKSSYNSALVLICQMHLEKSNYGLDLCIRNFDTKELVRLHKLLQLASNHNWHYQIRWI